VVESCLVIWLRQNEQLQAIKRRSCPRSQWFEQTPMRSTHPCASDVTILYFTIINEASEDEPIATQSNRFTPEQEIREVEKRHIANVAHIRSETML
jgi:hypothetical protein